MSAPADDPAMAHPPLGTDATAPAPVRPHPDALRSWPYHQALRAVKRGWWRGALAILGLVVGFLIVNTLFSIVGIVFDLLTGRTDLDALARGEVQLSPAVMLANNLSLAALIPLAMLLQWGLYGLRPRFLSSVVGAFRWRLLAKQALIVVPVWLAYVGLSYVLSPPGGEFRLTADSIALLLVVLLTTPLQSAGEEYGARGLLNRAAASWTGNPRIAFVLGAVVSSALFALAHLAGDPWLIAYYAVFGLSMCLVATWSGGLEGSVLIHAVNNVLLLTPTVLAGQQDAVFDRADGTGGPFMILPMAICLGVAALVGWYSRRAGAVTRTAPASTAPQVLNA